MNLLVDCVKAFGFALAFTAVAVLALCVVVGVGTRIVDSVATAVSRLNRRKHNPAKCKWCREVE